jgi:hypothetical protein
MTTTKLRTIIIPLMLSIIVASCGKNIREYSAGNKEASLRILIAANISEFKNQILEGLVKHYTDSCSIRVINLTNIKNVKSTDYDAIVLIDRALAWTLFNVSIRKFVDTLEPVREKEKIVIFLTAGDTKWKLQLNGVDGITAASKMDGTGDALEKLIAKIDSVLKNRQ